MTGLVAYGSLMHPDELARHCARAHSIPVRVRGFRRSFAQEPSWRAGAGDERGVLTVRPSDTDWFNGILICGADAAELGSLAERERGYDCAAVRIADIEPYATEQIPGGATEIRLYIGRDENWNAALLPNRAYLKLCIDAARAWGEEFARDFMRTTHVGEMTLQEFSEP